MHPMGLSYSDSTGSALAIPSSGMATAASDNSGWRHRVEEYTY